MSSSSPDVLIVGAGVIGCAIARELAIAGAGRVTVLSPWKLLDYWSWTREPKLEEYELL